MTSSFGTHTVENQVPPLPEYDAYATYVEESILPRLYREAPLSSILEGCGNIQCLDVLRALSREPAVVAAIRSELSSVAGRSALLDAQALVLDAVLADPQQAESGARRLVECLALALQAAVLLRADDARVAEVFCRSRLSDEHGLAFGTLLGDIDFEPLIQRAWPA